MGSFFSSLFAEMGARRRRLRASLGDRGQAICEFLVLSGLLTGSLGLFLRPWMPAAAPWGFWVPLAFIVGYLLIDARRQAAAAAAKAHNAAVDAAQAVAAGERSDMPEVVDEDGRTAVDRVALSYDWIALGWSFGCALLGVAAFVIAWSAAPQLEDPSDWTPPESAVSVDISP